MSLLLNDLSQFSSLVAIIAHLRGPDGCPWDREQSLSSMRENLLEECYEVLESIDKGHMRRLCIELGDLLMQVVFQAQLAAEAGEFELKDVIKDINSKLIRRHPHVFGSLAVADADEVVVNWEAIKKKERGDGDSILSGVPKTMPALAASQEIQSRVARVGFDWADDEGVIDKLAEEVAELGRAESGLEKEQEYGDLLFTIGNIARRQGIDLESSLRQANDRFRRRFACMEELCCKRGLKFSGLSFDEQNALWEEAKKKVA